MRTLPHSLQRGRRHLVTYSLKCCLSFSGGWRSQTTQICLVLVCFFMHVLLTSVQLSLQPRPPKQDSVTTLPSFVVFCCPPHTCCPVCRLQSQLTLITNHCWNTLFTKTSKRQKYKKNPEGKSAMCSPRSSTYDCVSETTETHQMSHWHWCINTSEVSDT